MNVPYKLPSVSEKNKALKKIVASNKTIAIPGIYNAASAMIAEKLGFKIIYLGGAATTLGMGLPDLGIISMDDMLHEAKKITSITSIPLICDVDTGYDNAGKTVRLFEEAGVSGIQIEDQEDFKKCGHLDNKKVISMQDMVKKIRSAVKARNDPKFIIIARTDARGVTDIDDAVKRCNAYAEAGADVIFPEALMTQDEFEYVSKRVSVPLLENMTEYGKTPYLTVEEFAKLGYNFVLFPVSTLRASLKTVEDVLTAVRDKGTQRYFVEDRKMMTRDELKQLIKYEDWQNSINKTLAKKQKTK